MRISDWSSDVCSSDLGSASFSGAKLVCMRLPQETAGLENTSGIERAAYPGLQGRDLWVAGMLRWHGSPYRFGRTHQHRLPACGFGCGADRIDFAVHRPPDKPSTPIERPLGA